MWKKLQCAINIWSRGSTFNRNTHSESSVVRHMHFVWEIYWFFNLSICLLIRQNQWWWQQWLLMMKVVVQHSGAGFYVSYCARCRSSSTCWKHSTIQNKTSKFGHGYTYTHGIDVLGEVNTRCQYLTTVNFFPFNFDAKNEQKKLYQIGRCICLALLYMDAHVYAAEKYIEEKSVLTLIEHDEGN